jgi:hypothetical protein
MSLQASGGGYLLNPADEPVRRLSTEQGQMTDVDGGWRSDLIRKGLLSEPKAHEYFDGLVINSYLLCFVRVVDEQDKTDTCAAALIAFRGSPVITPSTLCAHIHPCFLLPSALSEPELVMHSMNTECASVKQKRWRGGLSYRGAI